MVELAMCGYCCDLCKAFASNVKNNDQREKQIQVWEKYYGGFENAAVESIYCDGCRSDKPGAKRIDTACPVRKCVIERGLNHCGDCAGYPCGIFDSRRGLSFEEVKSKSGAEFDGAEYEGFLRAFDNKTRLDMYIQSKC